MFSNWFSRWSPSSKPAARSRPTQVRPCLECLEERNLLSFTSLNAFPNPALVGQSITFNAQVFFDSGDLFGGGPVDLLDGITLLGKTDAGLSPFGFATFSLSTLSAGSHSITAHFEGNAHGSGASTSALVLEVVNKPPPPPLPPPPPALAADVSAQVSVLHGKVLSAPHSRRFQQQVTLRNTGGTTVQGPLALVVEELSPRLRLQHPTGFTQAHGKPQGSPYQYVNVFQLAPGMSVDLLLDFSNPTHKHVRYSTEVLAGTGVI
jgi:hypothetical protein